MTLMKSLLSLLVLFAWTVNACGSAGGFRGSDGGPRSMNEGGASNSDSDSDAGQGNDDSGTDGDGSALGDAIAGQDVSSPTGCPDPSGTPTPSAATTFFVTSAGNGGNGGNLGGLSGADARCQCFASKVGLGGRTWHAYLSTASAGGTSDLVHAKDRIGAGPWVNYGGVQIAANVATLHASPPPRDLILTETGTITPRSDHDIFTGSDSNGNAQAVHPSNPNAPAPNCANWTSNSDFDTAIVGHGDWNFPSGGAASWNASHASNGCDPTSLAATAGSGRLYCFAIN